MLFFCGYLSGKHTPTIRIDSFLGWDCQAIKGIHTDSSALLALHTIRNRCLNYRSCITHKLNKSILALEIDSRSKYKVWCSYQSPTIWEIARAEGRSQSLWCQDLYQNVVPLAHGLHKFETRARSSFYRFSSVCCWIQFQFLGKARPTQCDQLPRYVWTLGPQ